MADEGERMPVRLVQENGDTISLDATSIDIVVERQQSNFGIPFFDARKMAIDLNQTQVAVEINGILADEVGQEVTAQATATVDLYQPQQLVNWGQPINSGGGVNTVAVSSSFNSGSTSTGIGNTGSFGSSSSGFGGSLGTPPTDFKDLGNNILQYWNKRYIDFPVAFWVEESGALGVPVTNGLQLNLKSDSLASTLSHNDLINNWTDSSGNGRNATQSSTIAQPRYKKASEFDSYIQFDGVNDFLTISNTPFLNSEEFTLIVACKNSHFNGVRPIITSSDASNSGYALVIDRGNTKGQFKWEGTSSNTLDTSGISVRHEPHIFSVVMKDSDSDAQSDTVTLFIDGISTQTTSTDFTPEDSSAFNIGKDASNFFRGALYEILFYNRALTDNELQSVEGYLSRKHDIKIREEGHDYYENSSYNFDTKHIRVAFDSKMVSSQQEPYGFLNQKRVINGMTISSLSTDKKTITVTGGNPQQFFEVDETERPYLISFQSSTGVWRKSGGRIYKGQVTAVTSNTISVEFVDLYGNSAVHSAGDKIYIMPIDYGISRLHSTELTPVIILPIKNADTFDEQALPEKAVGPEFPNHQDTSGRDSGNNLTRTDEYITYLLSKALTASYIDLNRPVDSSGNTTLNKVFSTSISNSFSEHASRLTITQLHATSLGSLSDTINSDLGSGQLPVIQGFSGGRSGKRVKSGGDKAQDLIGILSNSNNYATNPDMNFVTDALQIGLDFLSNQIGAADMGGDFIRGIQIPYNSFNTKGKNVLDAEVAQRNFFLTTEGSTSDKLSSANTVHASRSFVHSAEGHFKNGISGLVTDLSLQRDAEMKAYDFSLKFIAADIIL